MSFVRQVRRTAVGSAAAAVTGLVLVAVVTLAGIALAAPRGSIRVAAATAAAVPTSSTGFDLTAGASSFTAFTFAGLVTVTTPTGEVTAMDITASTGSLVDLAITVPCTAVPGLGTMMASTTSTRSGSTATAAQGLELYLTTLTVTSAGSSTTFTPVAPPPSLGDITVDSLEAQGLWASMPALSARGLAQHTSFCTP